MTEPVTDLAIGVLLSNLDGPGCGSVAAIQHPPWLRNGWEDQAVIEDPVENPLLHFKPCCFFLEPARVTVSMKA